MAWRKRNATMKAEARIPSSSAALFFPAKENTQAASNTGLASHSKYPPKTPMSPINSKYQPDGGGLGICVSETVLRQRRRENDNADRRNDFWKPHHKIDHHNHTAQTEALFRNGE